MHGVFMDVLGMGVLITGDSGVGKSELALELVPAGALVVPAGAFGVLAGALGVCVFGGLDESWGGARRDSDLRGDDFGDREQSMATARAGMMTRLRRLAGASRWLVLQLGFNWMGNRHQPLFEHGLKQEIIDFVCSGCEPDWSVRAIGIYDPATASYAAPDASNLARRDDLGEFLNRPIFLLKSLRA